MTIPFICIHHSDLMWRHSYDEYDKIRYRQLKHLLAMSRKCKAFKFGIEQSEILRKYIQQAPEDKEYITDMIKSGRIEPSGGLCIQDVNMVCGESIIMAHILGREFYKSTFGFEPVVACLTDAFGMCGQIPQILTKCGYKYLIPGRLPNRDIKSLPFPYDGVFRWFGLDGSAIVVTSREGRFTNHGAPISNSRILQENPTRLANDLCRIQKDTVNSLVIYSTEEDLIEEDLLWVMDAVNREGQRKFEFQTAEEYFSSSDIALSPRIYGEFNPTFSGCYTTRIGVKQLLRKAENRLFEEELMDVIKKSTPRDFGPAWYELILSGFHDALCGCHTDEANRQLLEKLNFVLNAAAPDVPKKNAKEFNVFNFNVFSGVQLASSPFPPSGIPCQKEGNQYCFEFSGTPYSAETFVVAQNDENSKSIPCAPCFKTAYFTADFTGGRTHIRNRVGDNVFGDDFGEVMIRADFGSMWNENHSCAELWRGRKFVEEKLAECTEGKVFFKVVLEGRFLDSPATGGNTGSHWPGFGSLAFRKEYIFPKNADYFTMRITLEWKGFNTKIAVKYPLKIDVYDSRPLYSVPFGAVERKPYFEVPHEFRNTSSFLAMDMDYETAKGDWPALAWVNYSDSGKGLSVANTGTPGHQLKCGEIMVSLLRSGTMTCDGGLVPPVGSYDNGTHVFDFAFRAHSPREMYKAIQLGDVLNHPVRVVAELPKSKGSAIVCADENIAMSAVRSVNGGILVRAYETLGRHTETSFKGCLLKGNLLMNAAMDGKILDRADVDNIHFAPFEIKTFIIKRRSKM